MPSDHAIEIYHRFRIDPRVIHLTTVAGEPGAIELTGRLLWEPDDIDAAPASEQSRREALDRCLAELDKYTPWHFGRRRMDDPGVTSDVSPDLCLQLMRSPAFQSAPVGVPRNSPIYAASYYEFVKRCFVFTDAGPTFLDKTQRSDISTSHNLEPDDPRNTPPATQVYYGVWQQTPEQPFYISQTRYVVPVIGVVSRDGRYLLAQASETPRFMAQAWIDCLHNYAVWLPENAPALKRRWKRKVYAMENDPDALLERVAADFPRAMQLKDLRIPNR